MQLGALPDGRVNAPEIGNTLLLHYPNSESFQSIANFW